MEQIATLTERTAIPITLVITIALGAMWVAEMHSHVTSMEKIQEDYSQTLRHIDERLSHIEGKMGVNFGSKNEVQTVAPSALSPALRSALRKAKEPMGALSGIQDLTGPRCTL